MDDHRNHMPGKQDPAAQPDRGDRSEKSQMPREPEQPARQAKPDNTNHEHKAGHPGGHSCCS